MIIEKKGFTLVELLIVIAILAVLSTAVVLILNPAELIKQSRDSTRISDLAALNSAIAFYLSDQSSATFSGTTQKCTTLLTTPPAGVTCTGNVSALTATDGTGWVNVNFSAITGGSPLSRLPLDPLQTVIYGYAYKSTPANAYEINANMESAKYAGGGAGDVETNTKDGGNDANYYEVGSSLAL